MVATAVADLCHKQNVDAIPVTSETLNKYIEFIKLNLRYSTIRGRFSLLRRVNTLLGYQDQTQTEELDLAISTLKRKKLSGQQQAVGINQDLPH